MVNISIKENNRTNAFKSQFHIALLVQQSHVFQLNWAKWVTAVSAGVWRGMKSN